MERKLPITELIPEIDAYMVSLGYTPATMRHYRQCWNALKNLALAEGEIYFTHELAFKLLQEHYHINPYAKYLPESKKTYRRAVYLLLGYQLTGKIAKRNGCHDHTFPAQFRSAGNEYIETLGTVRSVKDGTIKNHHGALEAWFHFLEANDIHDLNLVTIETVGHYLKTLAGFSKSFVSGRLQIIRRFMDFAYRNGYTRERFKFPAISVYAERKVPVFYTPDECNAILAQIDRSSGKGKRDYAMVLLGVRYGLRISDIKALSLENIDFKMNKISLTQVKTGKPLTLDLLPDVGWAIIDYLKFGRPETESKTIFVRHVHPYESFAANDSLAYMIRQYARAAGIEKQNTNRNSFHMLRYGLASTLLNEHVPLTTISGILGHSELNVTTMYTQIDVPQLTICALEVPNDRS